MPYENSLFLSRSRSLRMYFESKNIAFNFHRWLDFRSSDPDADDVGHKWSLSALLKHLKSENHDTGLLMRRIEEMIVKAILATAPPIVTACRLFVPYVENCFGDFFLVIVLFFLSLISFSRALCTINVNRKNIFACDKQRLQIFWMGSLKNGTLRYYRLCKSDGVGGGGWLWYWRFLG